MTETERNQIKGTLLKCAEENENKFTLTGHIVVSSLCKSAVERIAELEKENAEFRNIAEFQQSSNMNRYFENKKLKDENTGLKEKLDKIRKYLVYDIFDRFKYLENLLKISQETQEELCKRIIEQQKTIGSLTDIIDELKAQCLVLADCNTCHSSCKNENAEIKEQLTKAKEIVQKLCDIVCGRSGDDWELIKQAERFIREVEE